MQTAQIIHLSDYIPRKPADRVSLDQTYKCLECGHQIMTRKLWVDALIYCDRWIQTGRRTGQCGAEMRPLEMEAK